MAGRDITIVLVWLGRGTGGRDRKAGPFTTRDRDPECCDPDGKPGEGVRPAAGVRHHEHVRAVTFPTPTARELVPSHPGNIIGAVKVVHEDGRLTQFTGFDIIEIHEPGWPALR